LESHIAIQTGILFTLSVQQLVSCAPNSQHCGSVVVADGYGGGCNGSTGELAYDFISSGRGIVTEWKWGYTSYAGGRGKCTLSPSPFITSDDDEDDTSTYTKNVKNQNLHVTADEEIEEEDKNNNDNNVDLLIPGAVASIKGHSNLRTNSYVDLLHAVATKGPVVVNVAADEGWLLYKGGIYDDIHTPNRDINHVVVVEGYGTDPITQEDYWLVRNSWGPLWGEHGYIRLKRLNPYNVSLCTANAAAAAALKTTAGKGTVLLDECGECKMDMTPQDGIACVGPDFTIKPKPVMVCGTSGILYDGLIPVGGSLI